MSLQFKEPQIIRATYRIVTPMFIGDAEQKASGISPTSVKGALRFWWRALNWGRVYKSSGQSETEALKQLHIEESKLFGSAAEKGNSASFTLRVESEKLNTKIKDSVHPEFRRYTASRYMAYGLMQAFPNKAKDLSAGMLWRDCTDEGQEFSVTITSYDSLESELKQPLILLGLLGGLGSRVSRGLGSLAIQGLAVNGASQWSSVDTVEQYKKKVFQLIGNSTCSSLPPFSAISSLTSVDALATADDPYKCLEMLGAGMMHYRSWGKDNKVLGEPSEKNFKNDHDWKYKKAPVGFHPRRVMFGLPHNYGKGNHLAVTPEIKTNKKDYKHERRRSPLMFHIHKLGDDFVGIALLVPSKFLPDNEKINAGGTNVDTVVDWSVLTDLVYGNNKDGGKRFSKRIPIIVGGKIR